MYKFFVSSSQINKENVQILGEDVNHIKNVLRLNKEERIEICNLEEEKTYVTRIIQIEDNEIVTQIIEEKQKTAESRIQLHIFQGLPKQEKMEWIIQKVTEIGVSQIIPVKMERSIVKLDEKSEAKKIDRWQKIAQVAAKQSKRDKIPVVQSCINFKNLYEKFEKYDIVIVAYEEEQEVSIKDVLKQLPKEEIKHIAILIGPEGGIADKEIEVLRSLSNVKIITLGPRILRTETAPMVLSSIIMYEFNEME